MIKRCEWGNYNKLMQEYHDKEWGVPIHNDRNLFPFGREGKDLGPLRPS